MIRGKKRLEQACLLQRFGAEHTELGGRPKNPSQHVLDPLMGLRTPRIEAFNKYIHLSPMFIDHFSLGRDQHNRGRGLLNNFDATPQKPWQLYVVMSRPLEIFATRQ